MQVEIQHLTKQFKSGRHAWPVMAVNDVSFTIPDGKLIAMLGPSGCGKSTTLNMICGLLEPTSGKILFDGVDVTDLPPESRGIGVVFQNYALYPHMTALQNICFPLENLKGKDKLTRAEIRERALKTAKLVQIEALLDRKPTNLSGGQQQRVAIARALVKLPKLLLLDEPLSNLDARLRLQTREEIRRIQKETGITTAFVTHDQDEAMSISDLIVVLRDGVIQQLGKPQQVYDDPENLFVAKFLGTPQINVFSAQINGGRLYIGNDFISDATGVADGEVFAAIRPEGFIPCDDGRFKCSVLRTEIMGRDMTVLCEHEGAVSSPVRAIVDPSVSVGEAVSFDIKPNKLFVFSKQTEQRIRLGV